MCDQRITAIAIEGQDVEAVQPFSIALQIFARILSTYKPPASGLNTMMPMPASLDALR
jgi:hypothetical protein